MNGITFWHLLHTARRLKQQGWTFPMRLAYLAGMLRANYEIFKVNSVGALEFRLLKREVRSEIQKML
ncbi:hypothetical protein ES707_04069 [subsurface metagenome]